MFELIVDKKEKQEAEVVVGCVQLEEKAGGAVDDMETWPAAIADILQENSGAEEEVEVNDNSLRGTRRQLLQLSEVEQQSIAQEIFETASAESAR